jgi:hypothetical protein
MPQLYEDHAPVRAIRVMTTTWRVAQICTGRVNAVLVGKSSFQHKDFLASRMAMGRKRSPRGIAHEACRQTQGFVTHEIPALDPWGR